MISIVIPTLNESVRIVPLLKSLSELPGDKELLVADGGSTDGTPALAGEWACVIRCGRGRALQMNSGAAAARGHALWFVHGDSQVAPTSLSDIDAALSEGCVGGFFRLHFYDANDRFMRFMEYTSHLRARKYGLIFGDQGLFLSRELFESLGGFAPLALMEDWELARRLRPLHRRGLIRALETPIGTSARRFIQNGRMRTLLKNHLVKTLYILGVPTETLCRLYEGHRKEKGAGR
ncbi:MAG: glycosyltransferase family 2 protein [Fretibacterium sp.]|nr:glycosyltransferase family 2 protein [Fretibacterium sp.]